MKMELRIIEKKLRCRKKYRDWVKKVIKLNPKYKCGNFGDCLEAHHKIKLINILYKNDIKTVEEALNCKEIWDLDNGLSICNVCHRKGHYTNVTGGTG